LCVGLSIKPDNKNIPKGSAIRLKSRIASKNGSKRNGSKSVSITKKWISKQN
jgi:hypothetical protein